MSGIGQKAVGKVARISVECPDDIDGIVDQVRKIIMLGGIQSIVLKHGEPILYERVVRPGEEVQPRESTQSFAELTSFEVVRNVPMEEFSYVEFDLLESTPHEKVMRAFLYLSSQDWLITHLLVSPSSRFWKWLGLHKLLGHFGAADKGPQYFFNAKIELDSAVPDDVFIICGARTRHATIAEIGCSLKAVID